MLSFVTLKESSGHRAQQGRDLRTVQRFTNRVLLQRSRLNSNSPTSTNLGPPQLPRGPSRSRRENPLLKGGRFALAAILYLISASCGHRAADNLLLVSLDTVRADHLDIYGYGARTTPNIERLAEHGVTFTRAFSHVPSTLPSHCSMLTGLLPPEHAVRCNGLFSLSDSQVTMAEILHAHGFATGAILGAVPLERKFGLGQGFITYDDDFRTSRLHVKRDPSVRDGPGRWLGHAYNNFERRADEVTERALRWLDSPRGRWFLFVHYFDAHRPYEPGSPWRERFASPYDGEIAFVDHHVGRLVERVRKMPGRTLIILTADHGESLGEHGEAAHNRYLYNATQWVPLVLVLDGILPAGARNEEPAAHVDIMPTALGLLGVAIPSGLAGHSLLAHGPDSDHPSRPSLYAETLVWELEERKGIQVRSLLFDPLKIIWTRVNTGERSTDGWELYDLRTDPHELDNLFDPQLPFHSELAAKLVRQSRNLELRAPVPQRVHLASEDLNSFKNLGYLQGN